MSKTADDIERMLAKIEGRQVRCPECGGTDANIAVPVYELSPVRFAFTGEILVGENYDCESPTREVLPPKLICHGCKHEWPTPEGVELRWGEGVICECHETKLRREYEETVQLSLAGATCENEGCTLGAIWVEQGIRSDGIPYGAWFHVDTRGVAGERKCRVNAKTNDGKEYAQYCRVTLG